MASLSNQASMKAALLVVDMQEDFCPPNGTLAVTGGREIAAVINGLLNLPFVLKIATRDLHPRDHISFDTSHDPRKKAFESSVKVKNPSNSDEAEIPIWPAHCVQGTKGSDLIPELNISELDKIVEKGRDKDVEMFSGFADVFGTKSSSAASHDLAGLLNSKAITHVFVVGLAGDYCVKCTALDALKEGYEVFIVDEATKSVDPGPRGWGVAKVQLENKGAKIISVHGPDIEKLQKQP